MLTWRASNSLWSLELDEQNLASVFVYNNQGHDLNDVP